MNSSNKSKNSQTIKGSLEIEALQDDLPEEETEFDGEWDAERDS